MFLESFYQYIKGYYCIEIEGYYLERFLNLCMSRGVDIWNVKRMDDIHLFINIKRSSYGKVQEIGKISRCQVIIQYEKGIFHLLKMYSHRKVAILLIFISFLGIRFYTSRIWHIEIIGGGSIPIEELYSELYEENMKVGIKKKDIDYRTIKNHIYLRRDDVAWMGIDINGTKATVEFVERNNRTELDPDALPCNIVSNKDGVIEKISAKVGTKVVKVGDFVKSGDLLIEGKMVGKDMTTRLVHSEGEVLLKTWYEAKCSIPLEKDIPSYTGLEENKYQIEFGKYTINFINNSTNFEKYDTITWEENLRLFGKYQLPVKVFGKTFREITVNTIKYTHEQAIEIAKREVISQLKSQISFDENMLEDHQFEVVIEPDEVWVELTIECLENIGVKEIIG